MVGATLGAAVPSVGYVARVAEICRENKILLIADEIMSGMGRTAKPFAIQHWKVEPDMILVGKGIASGYAPLGAVLVSRASSKHLNAAQESSSMGSLIRRIRFPLRPGTLCSTIWKPTNCFDRVAHISKLLRADLEPLQSHPNVGDIRGMGLLWVSNS